LNKVISIAGKDYFVTFASVDRVVVFIAKDAIVSSVSI